MVIAGLLLVLVVVEVTIVVARAPRSAARISAKTWAAAISPIIDRSTALGAQLQQLRSTATGLGRVALERDVASLVSGNVAEAQELRLLGLDAPSSRAGTLLSSVLAYRVRTTELFAQGVGTAINRGPGTQATAALSGAASAMGAGDASYRQLSAAAPRAKGIPPLPASSWSTNPSAWTPAALAQFAAALSAAPGLQPVQAIRMVAVSVSPPALDVTGMPTTTTTTVPGAATTTTTQVPPPGSVTLLPPTSHLRPIVIVANRGNVAARGVAVVATLTRMTSPPVVQTSRATVGALGPYRSRYLVLPPFGARPGRSYRLSVATGIAKAGSPNLYHGQTASVQIHVAA